MRGQRLVDLMQFLFSRRIPKIKRANEAVGDYGEGHGQRRSRALLWSTGSRKESVDQGERPYDAAEDDQDVCRLQ